jgi:nitroreductase
MELYEVMRTTPAVRAFTDQPVSDDVLYRILDHARFAPSGGNRQGWRVLIIKDAETRRRIRDLYVLGWREYVAHVEAGLTPFAPTHHGRWLGPAVDLERARQSPRPNPFADHLDQAPALLVLVAELGALACLDNGLDRQSIVSGASIYPLAQNILLGARNEGLGGVMTSVLVRQEPAARQLLGLPEGFALAALLVLGYPRRRITRLSRHPVEQFAFVDHFSGAPFRVTTKGEVGNSYVT